MRTLYLAALLLFATNVYAQDPLSPTVFDALQEIESTVDYLDNRLDDAIPPSPNEIQSYYEFGDASRAVRVYKENVDYAVERTLIERARWDVIDAAIDTGQVEVTPDVLLKRDYVRGRLSAVHARALGMQLDANLWFAVLDAIDLALNELAAYANGELRPDLYRVEQLYTETQYLAMNVPTAGYTCEAAYWVYLDNGYATLLQISDNVRDIGNLYSYHAGTLQTKPRWMLDAILPGDSPLWDMGRTYQQAMDIQREVNNAIEYDLYDCFGTGLDIW